MANVLFFGYGANRDKKRLEDVFQVEGLSGEDLIVKGGKGARVDGSVLAIQTFDQLPEKIKESIKRTWGDTFRAYTLKSGEGQVAGVIWDLSEKQYEVLRNWEHDGIWREMKEVEVITTNQKKLKVMTEQATDESPIKEIVDGLNYENNLNKNGMKITRDSKDDDEYRIREIVRVREELKKIASA